MTNARQSRNAREKSAALQAEAAAKARQRRVVGIAVAVIATLLVAIGASVLIRTAQQEAKEKTAVNTPANVTDGTFVDGQASAPVTLRVYFDYQCPVCKDFETSNEAQIDGWVADGTVKVEYKPVAILDRFSTDGYSTRAANAAYVMADSTPANWVAYHKLLFKNQPKEGGPGLSDDQLVQLAVRAGATEATVRPGIDGKTFSGYVTKQTEAATSGPDKVTGTPTVLVNGELVKNAAGQVDWSPANLKRVVEEAAAK